MQLLIELNDTQEVLERNFRVRQVVKHVGLCESVNEDTF